MRRAIVFLFLVTGACPKTPEINNTPPTEAAPSGSVTLVGTRSQMIMQSPIAPSLGPEGKMPEMWYLDVNGDPAKQVTLYSEKEPSCPGDIEVIGRPREVTASKGGSDITFTQYDVESWRCL